MPIRENSIIDKIKILTEIIKLVLYFNMSFSSFFSLAIGFDNSGKESKVVTGISSSLASALMIN